MVRGFGDLGRVRFLRLVRAKVLGFRVQDLRVQ